MGTLSPAEKAAKAALKKERDAIRLAALDIIKTNSPEDAPSGYSVESEKGNESPWVKRLGAFGKDLETNAFTYFNYHIKRDTGFISKKQRTPTRIISPEGFPPNIKISYVYPPPYAFRNIQGVRDIRHFVFHSMGHGWHAGRSDKKRIGWMNKTGKRKGCFAQFIAPSYRYIPNGTTDIVSMENYNRFSQGMQWLLRSAALSTAHFMIDRAGNLVVVGDVNDIMYTSNNINETSVGVELEEAFIAEEDPSLEGNIATWKPGKDKPGGLFATAGNVTTVPFSAKQLKTLAILVRKMETMYPTLKGSGGERNISFQRQSMGVDSLPGYLMHDWVREGTHIDVNPQFVTKKDWNQFFKLVKKQNHITKHNCFRAATYSGKPTGAIRQIEPLAAETLTASTERLYNAAKETGVAQDRVANLINSTKALTNMLAGVGATRASEHIMRQAAAIIGTAIQLQAPIMELAQPNNFVCEDGFVAGHDDMWEF